MQMLQDIKQQQQQQENCTVNATNANKHDAQQRQQLSRAESGQTKQFEDTPRPNGHGAIKLAEPQPQRSPQPTMPMPNMPGNIRKLQQQQQPRQHSNCAALRRRVDVDVECMHQKTDSKSDCLG